ncbi:glutamate ABC transporter substrate-binding protein [Leucobacter luti]|uniref:Amino acid ABC transporter substrate-binding protein (PAAT family) n=1 Tax=Leucobacter luti TaxID=340320 RepID=A0A4R6S835_9MICO|nr:glutamate ABC transporter substrate-binding protein [Leucobacter luti]MCW2288821.1 glutamate transport system substrate-binding protein [Leucobacter luti]QYM75277.1 glutamate ABC transporter substrate-binding protein [Leucobacter luti]TCK45028.1 amino acid ABC transporter substrate-binding protein (PAAT family) [Leucobacter luti]TDP95554.1 amino acid ABC transporter substrate-binding protein (PAAT family) [Leucobacter luti]
MRITKYAAVLAAAGALVLAGCSGGGDLGGGSGEAPAVKEDASFPAGSTMEKLNKAGKITVGTKYDQPLFGLRGLDGDPEGFDVEIAKIIAGELGISEDNIEWIEAVSANREPFIEKGEVDIVVATYTINDTRKEVVSFGGPYYIAGQDLLVLDGNPEGITSIDDVKGKKVCSVTGSTSAQNLKDAGVEVLETDTYSNCLSPLRQGEVVAASTDNVILAGLVDQNPGEFELVEKPFTEEPYGVGLAKDDDEFRGFINDTLEDSFTDGRWVQAWESTAGKVLSTPEPPAIDRY